MLVKKYSDGVEILSLERNNLIEKLKSLASKIRNEHGEVERIILFGSFARNNFAPDSDVDLAIIVNSTSKDFLKRQDDFIDYFTAIPLDVNLIIYTTRETEKMTSAGSRFAEEVLAGLQL